MACIDAENDNDFVPAVAGPNRWYVFGFTDDYLASLNLSYAPQEIAGVPGTANCHGRTVSTLARQYGSRFFPGEGCWFTSALAETA